MTVLVLLPNGTIDRHEHSRPMVDVTGSLYIKPMTSVYASKIYDDTEWLALDVSQEVAP